MPRIVAVRSKNDSGTDEIVVALSRDAVVAGPDGDPLCAVTLDCDQARSLAFRLSMLASEIENQETPGYRTCSTSLKQLMSVAVLHDGSAQGDRSFRAAFDLASRSLAALELIGIFGIDGTGRPSALTADYQWQAGWLERLEEIYTEQARAGGICFRSKFVPACDLLNLTAALQRSNFDMIVIPHRLTELSDGGNSLLQAILKGGNANVLFCP